MFTDEQTNELYSLWIHCKCNTPDHHEFHAQKLDALRVSWRVQNAVAYAGTEGQSFRDVISRLEQEQQTP